MKSMKMIVEEPKTMIGEPKEAYPYGLVLRLEGKQLEALEIEEMPEVQEEMLLSAKVKVIKVEQREGYKCVELQITDMALAEMESEESEESEEPEKAEESPKVVEGKAYGEKFYGYMG